MARRASSISGGRTKFVGSQARLFASSMFGGGTKDDKKNTNPNSIEKIIERMGKSLQEPAGPLYGKDILDDDGHDPDSTSSFIPQVPVHHMDGRSHKRILMLCTGESFKHQLNNCND